MANQKTSTKKSTSKRPSTSRIAEGDAIITGRIEDIAYEIGADGSLARILEGSVERILGCIGAGNNPENTSIKYYVSGIGDLDMQILNAINNTNIMLKNIGFGLFGKTNDISTITSFNPAQIKIADTFLADMSSVAAGIERTSSDKDSILKRKSPTLGQYVIQLDGQINEKALELLRDICVSGGLKTDGNFDPEDVVENIVETFSVFERHKKEIDAINKAPIIDENAIKSFTNLANMMRPIESICSGFAENIDNLENFADNGGKLFDAIDRLKTITDKLSELNLDEKTEETTTRLDTIVSSLLHILFDASISMVFILPGVAGLLLLNLAVLALCPLMQTLSIIDTENNLKKQQEIIENLGKIIVICTGVILIGALAGGVAIARFKQIMAFYGVMLIMIVTLAATLKLSQTILGLGNGKKSVPFKIADDFGKLILTLTGCLLLGALAMMIIPAKYIMEFLGILILMVTGVCLAISLGSKWGGKKGLVFAKELVDMVRILTVAMMAGALLTMMIPGFDEQCKNFRNILIGFVFGITIAIGLGSKIAGRRGITFAKDLAILVATLSLSMFAGAALMFIPNFEKNILTFGATLTGFLAVIGTVCGLLGALREFITPGIAIAYGIAGLIAAFAGAMLFAVKAIKNLKEITFNEDTFKPFTDFVSYMVNDILWSKNTLKLLASGPTVLAYVGAITGMSVGMSKVAKMIRQYADMRIPKYSDSGRYLGEERLTEDMKNAAVQNIKDIIVLLASTIIGVGEAYPEYFNSGLLKGKGKFAKITASISSLGNMIGSIAEGIKNYASMRIPEYDSEGNIKGYRELKDTDFIAATSNISLIVGKLGEAIIQTYNDHPELFRRGTLKDLAKAFGNYGEVFTGIANTLEILTSNFISGDFSSIDNLKTFIGEDGAFYTVFYTFYEKKNNGKIEMKEYMKKSKVDDIVDSLRKYDKVFERLKNISDNVSGSNADSSKIDVIVGMLSAINDVAEKMNADAVKKMQDEVHSVDQLVHSVNSINTNKANSIIDLIEALNKLNVKVDSLDELVALLNSAMVETLAELAEKIEDASKIIKDADKVQTKRSDIIKKSLRDIKDAMKQPLMVNVAMEESSGSSSGDTSTSGEGGSMSTANNENTKVSSMNKSQLASAIAQGIDQSSGIKVKNMNR